MDEPFATMNRVHRPYFRPGDAVRITRGALVELTGVVVRSTSNQNCVITIDGLVNGVLVVLPATSLGMADTRSF